MTVSDTSGLAPAMSVTQLFDALAIRVVGPKAWAEHIVIEWQFTDLGERYRMELSNGALIHLPTSRSRSCDAEITLTRAQLLRLLAGAGAEGVQVDRDAGALARLVSLTDQPEPDFAFVTP
jgi:alkyl sulfatase BDS1-like metallo-beta-lactamase superfamily hydrolase